jgi:hypothetical protein
MIKKINIILFTFLMFILINCVKETPMVDQIYQIRNSSGQEILIRGFRNFDDTSDFDDTLMEAEEILLGDEISVSELSESFNNPNNGLPTSSFNYSTVIVVFSGERQKTHSYQFTNDEYIFSDPTERNLLRGGNYVNIGNDIYEFIITQEDYDNATPCNGDCLD